MPACLKFSDLKCFFLIMNSNEVDFKATIKSLVIIAAWHSFHVIPVKYSPTK